MHLCFSRARVRSCWHRHKRLGAVIFFLPSTRQTHMCAWVPAAAMHIYQHCCWLRWYGTTQRTKRQRVTAVLMCRLELRPLTLCTYHHTTLSRKPLISVTNLFYFRTFCFLLPSSVALYFSNAGQTLACTLPGSLWRIRCRFRFGSSEGLFSGTT